MLNIKRDCLFVIPENGSLVICSSDGVRVPFVEWAKVSISRDYATPSIELKAVCRVVKDENEMNAIIKGDA